MDLVRLVDLLVKMVLLVVEDQVTIDGSVTVIDTQLGGSTGSAKVIIRIADPDTIDPSTTLQNVTFTVTRSAAYSNTIIFVKESGEGPDRITFGPNSGTVVVRAGFGAVYTRESVLINGLWWKGEID